MVENLFKRTHFKLTSKKKKNKVFSQYSHFRLFHMNINTKTVNY